MNSRIKSSEELLPHLFRQEYTKMTAVMCRHFGLAHLEIAEDIASETFLKASENWPINGIPQNPTAWLYTVAKNKLKDYFKHAAIFENRVKKQITADRTPNEQYFEIEPENIADSQLAMIFAVCMPGNSNESQICLALQILCGFSVQEIASAFLTKTETIKKRLLRARDRLRKDHFQIKELNDTEIQQRLDTVLKTLYLLFNEGYFSKTNDQVIRKDLCSEAIRLTLVLAGNPMTKTTQTDALLALMCYQSSRLDARTNPRGESILFEEQDRSLWDSTLIEKGNSYLVSACSGAEITKYHLEAGIAYWHTTPTDQDKWQHILRLYDQLVVIEHSPVTILNRLFAFAKVYGNHKAITEAEKINLTENNYYHELLGYLYANQNVDTAIQHYQQAISLTKSVTEKKTLSRQLALLTAQKQ